MKYTKYALAALAATGLTAGTVLAFAEPASSPLPQPVPKAPCPACPSQACGTAKCAAAASSCAAKACAAEKTACDEQKCGRLVTGTAENNDSGVAGLVTDVEESREAIGGPVNFGEILPGAPPTAEVEEEDSGCPDGKCESKKKKGRISLHLGVGTNGPIFRLTSAEEPAGATESCPNGACPASESACGKSCSKTAGETNACPSSRCENGVCTAAEEKACGKAAATACEAKPACAASACNGAACPASACATAGCAASACDACPHAECVTTGVAAVVNGDADDSCDCQDCCCVNCDCATAGCPPAPARLSSAFPAVAHVRHGVRADGSRFTVLWCAPGECGDADETSPGDILRNYNSYRQESFAGTFPEPPGRVRLTHLPDLGFPVMPPGAMPPANLHFTSFTAPVVAPAPPAAVPTPHHSPIEGTWTRKAGSVTTTVTCRRGRIEGDARIEGRDEPVVSFSGLCSVSKDGLLYGVVETVEANPDAEFEKVTTATLQLLDQPFSIRFTTDGDSLIVKDVRCAGLATATGTEAFPVAFAKAIRYVACGRYSQAAE